MYKNAKSDTVHWKFNDKHFQLSYHPNYNCIAPQSLFFINGGARGSVTTHFRIQHDLFYLVYASYEINTNCTKVFYNW